MIPDARGKMNNENSSSAQLDAHKSNLFVNKYLPSKLLHFPRIKRHSFTVLPLFAVTTTVFTRCNCIYISFEPTFVRNSSPSISLDFCHGLTHVDRAELIEQLESFELFPIVER